jgi:hypothetical protein
VSVPARDEAAMRAPVRTQPVAEVDVDPHSAAWIRLQRTAGNAAVVGLLGVQRDKKKKAPPKKAPSTDPPQKQLADIQGHAMDALLPELAALEPEVRGDEALGVAVGGTRLVMAMQTVKAKAAKTTWKAFLDTKKVDFLTWPPDQIGSMLRFLGAGSETAAMQELAVSELAELIGKKPEELPLTPEGRTDLIRKTVGQMSAKEMGYGSTQPFVDDVKQRVLVSIYMQYTQAGTEKGLAKGFSYPNRKGDGTDGVAAKVNDAAKGLWGPNKGGEAYYFELSDQGKQHAYQAITALFTPQTDPKARTLIHCDYLISLIEYRAWAETIGVTMFDDNVRMGNIVPVLKYDGFADLAKDTNLSDGTKVVKTQPLSKVTLTSESEFVIGDHVVFYNHPTYDALTEGDPDVWKLENAVVVSSGKSGLLFQGHGYPTPLPKSALMDALCAKYNLHVARARKLIADEKAAKGASAKAAARTKRETLYPRVKIEGGRWVVSGTSTVTGATASRPLGELTPATAPGLRHPRDNALIARRPVRE